MAEALGLASAVAGLVSLAIEVSRISFEYASGVRHASKAVSDYLRELSALTSVILRLQNATTRPEVRNALEDLPAEPADPSILECMGDMTRLKTKLEKYTGNGLRMKIKTLLWPFEEKETRKLAEMFQRYCSILEAMISADTLVVSSKVLHEVRSMIIDDRRSEILAWLSSCPYQRRQAEILESHCDGTGQWLLETAEYTEWLRGEKNVLWCYGNRMSLARRFHSLFSLTRWSF